MTQLNLTVSEFNTIFADIIHHQLQLNQLCISGEITQFNYYGNRHHLYLTLSHENAHLQCVIYNQQMKTIPIIHKGDNCRIIGQCKYLKNKGQLIFSGINLTLIGKGNRKERFEEQINAFKTQGLLSKKKTEDIPRIIEKACIITANESAAYHDIKSILSESPHTFESILIPSSVQGINAPNELRQALSIASSLAPDIICITRGGGAEQDFDCFFDDELAHQICNSSIAIITGIGHQINTTLCCLCANQAFETPSAMIQWLITHSLQPIHTIKNELHQIKQTIINDINTIKLSLHQVSATAHTIIQKKQLELENTLSTLCEQLYGLNPIGKLSNGFNYCEAKDKTPLITIDQIKKNDRIYMVLNDGKAEATITHVDKKRTFKS